MEKEIKSLLGRVKDKESVIVCILILILVIQCLGSLYFKSHIIDELPNIARAANLVLNRNFELSIMHPPLINALSGMPFLFLHGLKVPPTDFVEVMGYEFLYKNNYSADFLIFLATLPSVLISILLALLIYRLARRLYGWKAGIFALFLYVFNPAVLSASTLFTTDIGLAFFSFLAIYMFLRYAQKPDMKNLLVFSVCMGLALLTKYTSLFLIPLAVVLLFYRFFMMEKMSKKNTAAFFISLAILAMAVLFVINLSYCFSGSFRTFRHSLNNDRLVNMTRVNDIMGSLKEERPSLYKPVKFFIENVPLPLPYDYIKGIVVQKTLPKRPYYFLGNLRYDNIWQYNIVVFLLKSPVSLLFFMVVGTILFFIRRKSLKIAEKMLIISLLFIFLLMVMFVKSGVRYLVPLFPYVFVLTSKITEIKIKKFKFLIYFFAILYILSSLSIFPNYLSFYNELIGTKKGCMYSLEADCDYGQGIRDIKEYMERNHIDKIKLSFFGSADPDYYGINYEPLANTGMIKKIRNLEHINCSATDGIIVISKWNRYVFWPNEGCFNWLAAYEPIDEINHNILVYNISSQLKN